MSGRNESASTYETVSSLPLMGVERGTGCGGGGGEGREEALNGVAAMEHPDEPPRKRTKLHGIEDVSALRKRVLEYKLLRLKNLRERFTEQLSELYFLQAGGNMMDYSVWRKKPPGPQLTAFLEARRPPPAAPPPPEPPPVPPRVPSPVVVPEVACPTPVDPSPVPVSPATTTAPAISAAAAAADEMVEKAKQEAYVATRVAELARAGLWTERRLPRVLEPPRPKTHWDYLLEEMAWLAQDFAHERKWKKQAAKKCARAVQKYFQDKAVAAQKAEKAQELQLKKIASFAAKEIRMFWSNVEKLVEWKRVRRVERARKEALDEQLSYIVDRTERYSRQLAANLGAAPGPGPAAVALAAPDTPPSDDEFQPRDDSDDDEETIAAAEQEAAQDAADHRDELEALRRESDLDLGDLLPPGYVPAHSPPPSDYGPDDDSADDEDTIAEQERNERPEDAAAELAALKDEADIDIDELVSQYKGSALPVLEDDDASSATEIDSDDDDIEKTSQSDSAESSESEQLEALMDTDEVKNEEKDNNATAEGEQRVEAAASLAATLQPTGTTLSETAVATPLPRLLRHSLREYQHVGLHWLATMHARRLNGILADEMGLGKTIQTIALLAHLALDRRDWGPHLVVAPTSVVLNWEMEFKKWRLLLTGTPLQNSLLELWSLMHFLMPDVFASHSEFREWFAPVAGIADGTHRYSDELVRRLHEVLRPFLLRRLKADVERQMPRKYEHVLMCRLSKRQRFLYDDFMSRAKTKESLASGNLLSVINVLMQLRKVCNHPDLFEPRPVSSPLQLPALPYPVPALALVAAVARQRELAARLGGDLASLEVSGAGAFAAHRARHLAPPRRLVEELPDPPPPSPPRPPPAALRLHLRLVPRAPPTLRIPPTAPTLAPTATAVRPPSTRTPLSAAAAVRPPTCGSAVRLEAHRRASLRRLAVVNERRCWRLPLFGADLRSAVNAGPPPVPPRNIEDVLEELHDVIDRFVVCWSSVRAAGPQLTAGAGARWWRRAALAAASGALVPARAALALMHAPAARAAVAFPHPRLLQYDCGKLQTLDGLLRRLKAGSHRVLIFTQMTRVLDVLEAFLCMHGHAYLRLDGATRVDQRQPLVDRFNADARIFAFILSTRSGGVGLNLTGADSVVFYDSDWNPTMDAQAQDRCHRIGQTRDVHVFRLVTAATVEENILRKAEQKRTLGHLAIEDGHFTTSYLRGANIKELFGAETEATTGISGEGGDQKETETTEGGELESALAAAEDEADAAAAQAARAEAQGDLAEFDETVPLDDDARAASPRRTPAADPDKGEFAALMKQLTPVEKYAMRLVENSEAATEAERAALGEMRRQLREWEQARRALRDEPTLEPEPDPEPEAEPDVELTYCREDARTKIWVNGNGVERMPMWCPPTPPSSDGDVYCDSWARSLYRRGAAADALLPPVRWRDSRAPRSPRRARPAPRSAHAPPSLFERAGSRPRPRARPPPAPPRDHAAPPPDWAPCEDAALRRALRLQRVPPDPPAAHAPNWDWLADLVGETARAYRSPRACRDRHDALADPERARRKHRKPPPARRRPDDDAPRPPLQRLDAMREAAERRRAAPKRRLDDAAHHNPKHAALLADHGVDYDTPPSPMEVATRRAERIAKEKMKAGAGATISGASVQAPTPTPSAPVAPQRIVVAAHGAQTTTAVAPAGGKVDARRPRPAEAPRASAPPAAQLLYRQQTLAGRHHLKILHHASPTQAQSVSVSAAGGVSEGGATLRTLQLQQLALRRPRAPAPGAAPHVVLAHLAPAPPAPPAPAAAAHHHPADSQQ